MKCIIAILAPPIPAVAPIPPAAPTVTRSQDYDGKITFSSSNDSVVKVHPDTGELTVVGAGTAIISVSGAETDYRLAPLTKTYTVFIEKATPFIAFPAAEISATYGDTVSLPPLTVTWYEGTVTYASVNEAKAVVAATGAETENCYEAQKAEYTLTIADPSGISGITADAVNAGKAYDLQGRKLNVQTTRKGVYVVGGKKVVVK